MLKLFKQIYFVYEKVYILNHPRIKTYKQCLLLFKMSDLTEINNSKNIQDRELAKKNSIFSKIYGYEKKELDDLIVGGYIATTHVDSGFYDEKRGLFIRDKIAKETLKVWADEINNGVPRANKASVNHNREPHVTGVGIRGSAKIHHFEDGEYGLYVDTLVDKTKKDFDETKYRIENNLLDSFFNESILF